MEREPDGLDLEAALIEMADVAKALGGRRKRWSTERARRWLRRAGAAKKINGRWITTPQLLRELLPPVWDAVATRMLLGED